jgi:anti-sigma B factor antagonist
MINFQRTDQGEETRLRIEGTLDAVTVAEIRATIDAIVDARRSRVLVDLTELHLIDSSGIGAIVSLYKRLREANCRLDVVGVRDQPLAIFRLLRLDRIFSL